MRPKVVEDPSGRPGQRALRALAAFTLALSVSLVVASARADGGDIPAGVLAQLLSKIPAYDHGFRERAGRLAHVMILTNSAEPESVRAGTLLLAALLRESFIAGLPHQTFVHSFASAEALAAEVRRRQVSIVYVTAGLSDNLEAICRALEPLGVLTMANVPEYVERCVVVGFQILAGRPKILVHLRHAQQNGVRFQSELLELAKVYR